MKAKGRKGNGAAARQAPGEGKLGGPQMGAGGGEPQKCGKEGTKGIASLRSLGPGLPGGLRGEIGEGKVSRTQGGQHPNSSTTAVGTPNLQRGADPAGWGVPNTPSPGPQWVQSPYPPPPKKKKKQCSRGFGEPARLYFTCSPYKDPPGCPWPHRAGGGPPGGAGRGQTAGPGGGQQPPGAEPPAAGHAPGPAAAPAAPAPPTAAPAAGGPCRDPPGPPLRGLLALLLELDLWGEKQRHSVCHCAPPSPTPLNNPPALGALPSPSQGSQARTAAPSHPIP